MWFTSVQCRYHAIGASYHSFCFALFTAEKPLVDYALETAHKALDLVETKRKVNSFRKSITNWFVSCDYNEYTEGMALLLCSCLRSLLAFAHPEEAHAEACFGDLNFIIMLLNFLSKSDISIYDAIYDN